MCEEMMHSRCVTCWRLFNTRHVSAHNEIEVKSKYKKHMIKIILVSILAALGVRDVDGRVVTASEIFLAFDLHDL